MFFFLLPCFFFLNITLVSYTILVHMEKKYSRMYISFQTLASYFHGYRKSSKYTSIRKRKNVYFE